MKWQEVIDRAERQAKESYEPVVWVDMINECLQRLESEYKEPGCGSLDLLPSQMSYPLPEGLKSAQKVYWQRDVDRYILRRTYLGTKVPGYEITANTIVLVSVPVQAGDRLIVVGTKRLPRITPEDLGEDSPEITCLPKHWQWLLSSYCIWRAAEREGWLQEARSEEARWYQGFLEFASEQESMRQPTRLNWKADPRW